MHIDYSFDRAELDGEKGSAAMKVPSTKEALSFDRMRLILLNVCVNLQMNVDMILNYDEKMT